MATSKFVIGKMLHHFVVAYMIVLFVDIASGYKLTDGNQSSFPLVRVKRQPTQEDLEVSLVYATRTKLFKVPFHRITGNRLDQNQFGSLMEENAYLVQAFDVSTK